MSVFPQVGSFILASLVLLLADFVNAAPTVRVTPAEVIEGVPGAVIITGLKPGQGAVLHACRMWDRYPTGSSDTHPDILRSELHRPDACVGLLLGWFRWQEGL